MKKNMIKPAVLGAALMAGVALGMSGPAYAFAYLDLITWNLFHAPITGEWSLFKQGYEEYKKSIKKGQEDTQKAIKDEAQKTRDQMKGYRDDWAKATPLFQNSRHAQIMDNLTAARISLHDDAIKAGAESINSSLSANRAKNVYAKAGNIRPGDNSTTAKNAIASFLTAPPVMPALGESGPGYIPNDPEKAKLLSQTLIGMEGMPMAADNSTAGLLLQSKHFTKFARKQMAYEAMLGTIHPSIQANMTEQYKAYVLGAKDGEVNSWLEPQTVKETYRLISGTNALIMQLHQAKMQQNQMLAVMVTIMNDNYVAVDVNKAGR